MTASTSTVDQRFSEDGSVATTWADTVRALESAQLSWITTVRADGRPHMTPLVAVWLDGSLYFSTGAEEQKALNLRGNPHVILSTGCNEWDRGLDVMVEGDAVRVTETQLLHRLADAWTTKWDGRWQFSVGDQVFRHMDAGTALVFGVTPKKVLTFAHHPFVQTRHELAWDKS